MAWTGWKHGSRPRIEAGCLGGICALLTGLLLFLPAAAAPSGDLSAIHVGDPLIAVLRGFQQRGIRLIYSTPTVTAQMQVLAPPAGATVEEQLASLLAPHRLGLKPIKAGGWIVVPRPGEAAPVNAATIATTAATEPGRTPAASPLDAVVIETSRYGLERANLDGEAQLDRDLLTSMPDTDEDVARALQQFPGTVSNGLSARTHVRGGRDDETVFRYDGVTLYDPFHLKNFQGLFSAIDPTVSDSVRYWTGAFPIEFGGSIGGVVDIAPRRPTVPGIEAGLSVINSSLMVETPFAQDRGSILISARMSNLPGVVRLLDKDIGKPDFSDLTARATWAVGDRTQIAVGMLGLDDSISLSTDDPMQRATATYRDLYTWLKVSGEWLPDLRSETLVTAATLDARRNDQVTRLDVNNGFLDQVSHSAVKAVRQEFSWTPRRELNLRLGGEFSSARSDDALQSSVVFQPPFTPGIQPYARVSRDFNVHTRYSTLSIYGASRWRIAPDSIVEFGLRRDGQNFQDENERSQWNARVSFRQELGAATTLRLAWGQFSQPAAIGRLDISDGVQDLQSARRLNQVNASIEHTFESGHGVRIEAYDKHEGSSKLTYENAFSLLVLTPEIEVDRLAVNSSGARMRGVEITAQTDPGRPLSAWATYTYSTALDRIAGRDVPRSWSQPHAVQAGVIWRHGPWLLSGFASWHSGWPYTPLLASTTSWLDPRAVALSLGGRNTSRYDTFESLDLRASWTMRLRHGSLETSIELKNALDSNNACCRSYQVLTDAAGRATLVENQRDWLRLLPVLGIRWRL